MRVRFEALEFEPKPLPCLDLMRVVSGFPESILYVTSASPTGPWASRGVILDQRSGTGTVHQSIFDFNGASFISYHDASLPTGDDYRRSTCMDRLYYGEDGAIQKVVPTPGD